MSSGIIRPGQSGLRPNRDWRRFCVGKSGGGGGGTPVDMVTTFEAGTAGVAMTVGNLNSATTKTAAAAGTWTIPVVTPLCDNIVVFDPGARKFKVSGADAIDAATKSIKTTTTSDQIQCNYALTTQAPSASIGYALYAPVGESSFNFYNFGDITGTSGGDYAAFHYRTFATDQCGIEDGASNLGTLITIPATDWYWVTMLYDNPGNSIKLRVYRPSAGWAQVGAESSLTPTLTFDVGSFNVGRTDNHDVFGNTDFRTDYMAIALSTGVGATFPLLPA